MFRIAALVLRFVNNIQRKSQKKSYYLTINKVKAPDTLWIKCTQHLFQPRKEKINNLGIKMDEDAQMPGWICSTRRLATNLCTKGKPTISSVVMDAHIQVLHMGVEGTLAAFRSRFWVPNAHQEVKKEIRSCYNCKRYNAQPFKQPLTATIPQFRATSGYAVQMAGVDFARPLH